MNLRSNMDSFIALNGKIMRSSEARISPFDHGFLYGDGVYETLRTFGGKNVLDFPAHLARLRESAKKMQIPLEVADETIKELTAEVIQKNGFKEARVRISLTRGENAFLFSGAKNPTLIITTSELADYQQFEHGVSLVSIALERTEPEIKSISLLPMIRGKQAAQQAKAFDAIFLDRHGNITEGTVFNILLREAKTLIVAPPNDVLAGTAQHHMLAMAEEIRFDVRHERFGLSELKNCDEVIITNSLFGALPVKTIDEIQIKTCPGELFEACGKKLIEEMAKLSR